MSRRTDVFTAALGTSSGSCSCLGSHRSPGGSFLPTWSVSYGGGLAWLLQTTLRMWPAPHLSICSVPLGGGDEDGVGAGAEKDV